MKANIDFLTANAQGMGDVAKKFVQGGLNVNAMRPYIDEATGQSYITVFNGGDQSKPENYSAMPINNAATLKKDEWKILDQAVLDVAKERLQGVNDLVSRGLTYNITNGLASTVFQYEDVNKVFEASVSMDGNARGQNDRQQYDIKSLPLPIIHVDYQINSRALAVSRNGSNPMDTNLAEQASRAVAEKLESMLFTNETYTYGGGTVYSYLNAPNRNEVTLSLAWDDSSKTGAQILTDCINMKKAQIAAKHYGPYVIYVPVTYETVLDKDYDVSGTSLMTIRDRILKIANINEIKVVDTLTDGNVLMVQMSKDTVRWINALPMRNVEWVQNGGFTHFYKVLTIQVPQIRADQEGNSGVCHLSA